MKKIMLAVALVLALPAPPAQASHRGDRRCYEDECDGYDRGGRGDYSGDQDYDQWNNDQRNHNRRNRGAFSPGPFDRSPVTIIICPPGTQYCGSGGGRQDQPPPKEENPK